MARSNRKSHSKSGSTRRTSSFSQGGPQDVKLTKEQLAEDAKDQKNISNQKKLLIQLTNSFFYNYLLKS